MTTTEVNVMRIIGAAAKHSEKCRFLVQLQNIRNSRCVAIFTRIKSDQVENIEIKSVYTSLQLMNYFLLCNLSPKVETLIVSIYSIAITMTDVRTSYILYFHQFIPLQLGAAMPSLRSQIFHLFSFGLVIIIVIVAVSLQGNICHSSTKQQYCFG